MITRDKLEQRIAALEMAEKQRRDSMTITATVEDFIAPCYLPLHEDIKQGGTAFTIFRAGAGAAKTLSYRLRSWTAYRATPTGQSNAIVFRKVAGTMRDSVFSQIAWAIDMLGVSHLWKANRFPDDV